MHDPTQIPLDPLSLKSRWSRLTPERRTGFQEVWYLKLNDPSTRSALWLRFVVVSSANGFRRAVETWAVFFQKRESGEVHKVALKAAKDLAEFKDQAHLEQGLTFGDDRLTPTNTQGSIVSRGNRIDWNLDLRQAASSQFNLIPRSLKRLGIVRNTVETLAEDLRVSGWFEMNGARFEIKDAPAMLGHLAGGRLPLAWAWGHCNHFQTPGGEPAPLIFEGLEARGRGALGLKLPKLAVFYIRYLDQDYYFNSFWDSLRSRSKSSLSDWTFRVERGELAFEGRLHSEHRDFAGLRFEDTEGSFLYCANSKLAYMELLVFRRGKLEATFKAPGVAAFEIVERTPSPYVQMLI